MHIAKQKNLSHMGSVTEEGAEGCLTAGERDGMWAGVRVSDRWTVSLKKTVEGCWERERQKQREKKGGTERAHPKDLFIEHSPSFTCTKLTHKVR